MKLDFGGPVHIPFRKFEKTLLDMPVFQIFADVAHRKPDKVALKCGVNQLSYQQVYDTAISIAQALRSCHTGQEPVGIALPNDIYFPVAMLAALALGCPYLALDIDQPAARNQLIIEQSGLRSIITNTELSGHFGAFRIINTDTLPAPDLATFTLMAKPEDIAYIVYTSGSTGIPKGVFQNQQNLLHDVMQYINSVHVGENDRLSLLYSPSVNGSLRDIYGALLTGATLVIRNLKKTGLLDLNEFIREESITIYHSIPNIFRTFLKLNPTKSDFDSVRLIYLAGDRIYQSDVDLYNTFFPEHCLLYVGIGATEIATIYRQWFINHQTTIHQELIPLGYPVEDRPMLLLDDHHNEVANGEVGEIAVTSPHIALGYWKNEEQTRQSFVINAENRTYRTGDLGRVNDDGLLEFIGRKDNQVKINGYRIELSEIEGALMKHPDIDRCGVVMHTNDQQQALFSFYITKADVREAAVKIWLEKLLPAYMIPRRCIQVEEIPLLHNFKNDTKALKALAEKYIELKTEEENRFIGDNGFVYTTLKNTWARFLDENSFDKNIAWKSAGGDSVNAVNFWVQLESDLGTTLPAEWISNEMTPAEIYARLQPLSLEQIIRKEKIIYFFPAVNGMIDNTRQFISLLSEHAEVRIIKYPSLVNLPASERNWAKANALIWQQITDYNSPQVGFIGVCSGALVLNQLFAEKPPAHYSVIGILDARESAMHLPLYQNFFDRTIRFIKRGNLFHNLNRILSEHSYRYKMLTNSFRDGDVQYDNSQELLWHLFQRIRPSYFDGDIWYFGCISSDLKADGSHWKPYSRKVNSVLLNGNHEDMLDTQNRAIVLAKLLTILESR